MTLHPRRTCRWRAFKTPRGQMGLTCWHLATLHGVTTYLPRQHAHQPRAGPTMGGSFAPLKMGTQDQVLDYGIISWASQAAQPHCHHLSGTPRHGHVPTGKEGLYTCAAAPQHALCLFPRQARPARKSCPEPLGKRQAAMGLLPWGKNLDGGRSALAAAEAFAFLLPPWLHFVQPRSQL